VGRRTEAPVGHLVAIESVDEGVEGEVEVEARLLTVGDHVEARPHLIHDRRDGGVLLHLDDVGGAECCG
jgi:hypothetical protein